jgi:anthranilate phosphoribosyltransferase
MSTPAIHEIIAGRALSVEESKQLTYAIINGAIAPAQIAALLTTFAVRGIDVDVLDGFSQAVLELARPLDLGGRECIDVCGTGGDGKGSFNISTTVAFILAGAGYAVAKHGNVAVSSACGSSNVLQQLGITLSEDASYLRRLLDLHNICFIHAPLFHPAFKQVASLRKELGFRTIFNALGPLINPARVAYQYTGVYNLELQRLYAYLLRRRGQKFAVVHSLDGYDEISLTAPTRVVAHCGTWELSPHQLQSPILVAEDLTAPVTPQESAQLIERILTGNATASQRKVVIANAAVAIWCYEGARNDLAHCKAIADESLISGSAYRVLQGCRGLL